MTGFIDLLDQTTNLSTEQKGYVQVLKASAAGLMAVINDVLDYSKLEAGKMKLDIIPFEPKAVVEGSLAAIAVAAEEKGLTLQSSIPNKGVPVKLMGDPNRLRQILLNLLNNAVKFTQHGTIKASVELLESSSSSSTRTSAMTISTISEDASAGEEKKDPSSLTMCQQGNSRILLRFSVEDTGIGIDPNNLSDIFRQYRQAAPAIASSYGGTGLGLSICKSLVDCMGGTIGVDSSPGKGSKFWFQISFDCCPTAPSSSTSLVSPQAESLREPGDAAPSTTPASSSVNSSGVEKDEATDTIENKDRCASASSKEHLHVLVAEDNGVNQKLISRMLSRLGHTVSVVENGREAVEEVQNSTKKYDLVLMDIQMPIMDGIDATKEIRWRLGLTVPIVGLTASVRRDDFETVGFNGWIGKPVRLSELQGKLNEFV